MWEGAALASYLKSIWWTKMQQGLFQFVLDPGELRHKHLVDLHSRFNYTFVYIKARLHKRKLVQKKVALNASFDPSAFNFHKVRRQERIFWYIPLADGGAGGVLQQALATSPTC